MKGLKQLFSLLLMVFIIGVGNVWAVDPDYTLTPTAGSNNSYAGDCDVTISDITWNVTGNATMVPWRIGGKSITNTDRTVYSKTAYASAVDSIRLTIGAASSVTINKISLVHSTSSDFSNSTTIDAGGKTASTTYTFKPAAGFPKDSYFKFVFNVTIGGSNKYIEFTKVEIYNTPSGDPDPEPTCSTPTITFAEEAVEKLTTAAAFTNAASVEFESVATSQAITYSVEAGKEGVATVNATTGEVTIVGAGEAKIYASVAAEGDYCEKSAYYTLTVTEPPFEGTVVTWTASEQGYENGTQYSSATADANISFAFGDGTNDGKYYTTGTGIRIYANGKVTVTADNEALIKKIVITYSDASYTGTFSADAGNYSLSETTGTWTGSASSVVLTNTASSGHARIQTITVSYTGGSESDPVATLSSISIKTAPTTLTYVEGQKFNPAGLVITKNMSDATTEDIAYADNESAFTFAPTLTADLATSNTQVTITYGGKSVDQAITVNPFTPTAGVYEIALNKDFYGIATAGNNAAEQSAEAKGITIVSGCTSSASNKTYYDAAHIRYYADSYLKLTAPAGYEITKVVFTAGGTWNNGPKCGTNGSYDNDTKTWTGNTEQLDLNFADQNRVSKIAVTYAEPATLESVTVSGAPTKKEYIEGDNFAPAGLTVTGNYSDESHKPITEGITWSTPATLTAGQTSVSITATVAGVTSAAYEVTGLTVNAAKNLDHITLNTDDVTKVFWKGETFNYTNLVVTAYYDDETYADVEPLSVSTPNMTLFGEAQTITVSYREAEVTKEATYEVTVKTIANTQETAYTVAEAIALIDAGKDLSTKVYVKGKVSQIVTPWSDQYNNVTYAISEDGKSTSAQFQLYRCITNDIEERGDVVAFGTLTKYNSTYELAAGNSIVSYTAPTPLVLTTLTISGDATQKEYTEGDEFDPTGLVVTATYDDESYDVLANGFDWHFSPATLTVGTISIQVTVTKDAIESAPFTVTGLTVTPAPVELEDGVFTSNATITAGTYSYLTEKINIGEYQYDAFKISTSKNPGDLSVILPVGTTKFGFHAVSWGTATTTVTIKNGEDVVATYSATGANISGSSPYTYDDDTKAASYHYYVMEMEALTEQVTLNLSAPARVVFYGVNIEATTSVTVGDAKWATFAPSFNVVLPDQAGVKFHYVVLDNVESDKSKLMTTTIEPGTTIKAGEGILVQAKPNTEVVFDYAGPEAAEIEGNLLKGVFISTPRSNVNDNCYIFTQNDGTVGFKHWETGSLAPNKCYLDLSDMPAGVAPRFIRLATEDTNVATDLDALQSEQTEKIMINGVIYIRRGAELYDVTGRLVK